MPSSGLDLYFNICKALRVDISMGYLFRSVSKEGLITAKALDASATQATLNVYAKQLKCSIILVTISRYTVSEVAQPFQWH